VTTDIINGGFECGKGYDETGEVTDRIGFYKQYCDILGVRYGNNLDCYNMEPFGQNIAAQSTENSRFDN
jgi:basic endochitinase B